MQGDPKARLAALHEKYARRLAAQRMAEIPQTSDVLAGEGFNIAVKMLKEAELRIAELEEENSRLRSEKLRLQEPAPLSEPPDETS